MMYGMTEEDCTKAWNTRVDAAPDTSAEPVGVAGEMPGSNGGFSMSVFRAIDVPVGTKLYTNPAPSPDGLDVDALAQEIRRVDGNHKLGAAALAEALMPFLKSWLGVGPMKLTIQQAHCLARLMYRPMSAQELGTSSEMLQRLSYLGYVKPFPASMAWEITGAGRASLKDHTHDK